MAKCSKDLEALVVRKLQESFDVFLLDCRIFNEVTSRSPANSHGMRVPGLSVTTGPFHRASQRGACDCEAPWSHGYEITDVAAGGHGARRP